MFFFNANERGDAVSEFIIASISDENRFIQYDSYGKLTITNRKEKATRFSDSGKAWRVIQNQMSKKKRDGWKIIAYETKTEESSEADHTSKKIRANLDTSIVNEEPFDWDEIKFSITGSYAQVILYKEHLTKKLVEVNAELCDCEHACEFYKYDVVHGYKLYAMMRERRIRRRFYKDELQRVEAVLNMSYSEIIDNGIESAFKKISEQTYAPRALPELFEGSSPNLTPNAI